MPLIRWQFVCERDLGSRTIAWFSQGHVSHVDCVLERGCLGHGGLDGYLLGARDDHAGGQLPGVRIRPPRYHRFARRVVMSIACTETQRTAFFGFLERQLGKPYDGEAILAFVFNRNWREPDSWICSELQAAACEAAGLLPRLVVAANKITPVALMLAFSAAGATIEHHPKTHRSQP
jgi:hypothetical protein